LVATKALASDRDGFFEGAILIAPFLFAELSRYDTGI
jgi:hypothetical protein